MKELNVNYTHDRVKEMVVHKLCIIRQRVVRLDWD
jgi:hypothetical protein